MSNSSFQLFIDLIAFDQRCVVCQQAISDLNFRSQKCDTLIQDCLQERDLLHERMKVVRKQVDEKEREMRDLDQREKEIRHKFDSVANDREYKSLKNEAERMRTKQHLFEEELLMVWNEYETVKKDVEAKLQALEQREKDVEKEKQETIEKQSQEEVALQRLYQERSHYEKNVPVEWLEKYARMRERVKDPVVPVVADSCSVCFHILAQQDLVNVLRGELVTCRGCFRLLYTSSLNEHTAGV